LTDLDSIINAGVTEESPWAQYVFDLIFKHPKSHPSQIPMKQFNTPDNRKRFWYKSLAVTSMAIAKQERNTFASEVCMVIEFLLPEVDEEVLDLFLNSNGDNEIILDKVKINFVRLYLIAAVAMYSSFHFG
jgi:hypothetical protein